MIADRSFRSLILQAWPLLSLNKEQLSTTYLTQHIMETAGIWCILLMLYFDTDVAELAERGFDRLHPLGRESFGGSGKDEVSR